LWQTKSAEKRTIEGWPRVFEYGIMEERIDWSSIEKRLFLPSMFLLDFSASLKKFFECWDAILMTKSFESGFCGVCPMRFKHSN